MKHITVVFKNAIQIEGSLLSLDDNEMVLQSLDGVTSTVIPDVRDSILFYKVNSSKETYDEISSKPHKTQSDLEELARARGDLNSIERSGLRERIMNSPISKPIPVPLYKKDIPQYVSRNQPVPRPVQYSEKKIARTDTPFTSGLQSMFPKKH